jgi:universal stress protein F
MLFAIAANRRASMYKNIAVPVSFDQDRDVASAVGVAKCLADTGARITFLHVMEIVPAYVVDIIPQQTFTARTEEIDRRLKELTDGIENASAAVIDGAAGRTITKWASDNGADCIVIASHRPVMSDILLGSTAAWVVRHANCAVHVVR